MQAAPSVQGPQPTADEQGGTRIAAWILIITGLALVLRAQEMGQALQATVDPVNTEALVLAVGILMSGAGITATVLAADHGSRAPWTKPSVLIGLFAAISGTLALVTLLVGRVF